MLVKGPLFLTLFGRGVRRALGWQTETLEFPPKYALVSNKLGAEFAEKRRIELHNYMRDVRSCVGWTQCICI